LPLKIGRDFDGKVVRSRHLEEPGSDAVVDDVKNHIGPIVIFDLENYRDGGGVESGLLLHSMSSGASEQEAGRKQKWDENAADYHGLSDASAAAACRGGNPNVLHGTSRVEREKARIGRSACVGHGFRDKLT
jgi:hypothetical protein